MVRIDKEALGDDFYLPPMPDATEILDRPGVGACGGQLAVYATSDTKGCAGAVVAQLWHGKNPDIWGAGLNYYEMAHNLHLLGKLAGLTQIFEFTGLHTKLADIPASKKRPASTLVAMTYTTPEQFCDRANLAVSDIRISGIQPRFIFDRSKNPRYNNQTFLDDLVYPQRRVAKSDALGHAFRLHDQVVHGPAIIAALLRAPGLIETIRSRAVELKNNPHSAVKKETEYFLSVVDLALTTDAMVRTAIGDTDNPGMNDLAEQGVNISGGAETIRQQLVSNYTARVLKLHAA